MLVNKKIVLASGNSAICCEISKKLIDAGASVILIGDWPENKTSGDLFAFQLDISNVENLEAELDPFFFRHKPFDGFVFAWGIGGARPLALTKPSFMHDMMRANLYSFVEMSRLLTKKGIFNPGGSIVALSSVSSVKGLKSKIAYGASKAGLEGAVRSMAAELAEKKIRVNCVQKGWVTSDMQLDFIKNNRNLSAEDDFGKQLLGAVEPAEIADIVTFLLSDATKTITGSSIVIDGGYTL